MISDDELDRLVLEAATASRLAPMVSKPWELKLVERVPVGAHFTAEQIAHWELLVLTGLQRLGCAGYALDHLANGDVDSLATALQDPRSGEGAKSHALRVFVRLASAGFVEFYPEKCRVQITDKGRGFLWQQTD